MAGTFKKDSLPGTAHVPEDRKEGLVQEESMEI